MTARTLHRKHLGLAAAFLVFMACWGISKTVMYRAHPERFTLPLLADLTLTAPLAYWLVARKQRVTAYALIRIAFLGLLIATLLLSGRDQVMVREWRQWLVPIAEVSIIGYIIWRFVQAGRRNRSEGKAEQDFLFTTRQVLREFTGNPRAANILATEIAMFHYVFTKRKPVVADNQTTFSNFRKSGIILVLYAFLGIFVVETLGMHFLLSVWSRTAAWIVTALSAYSCLQLLGHIRAMRARPIRLEENGLVVRHGLMGGDVTIAYERIASLTPAGTKPPEEDHLKIALIRGMEKHTIELRTTSPVRVIRAFGIEKESDLLLLCIDEPTAFLEHIHHRIHKNA